MNGHEFTFLDSAEIKEFELYFDDYSLDNGNISYENLKEIVLSYPKFDKNLGITKLTLLYKKLKDSASQFGDRDFYISISL
jgi:hypothetical protein